jgi:hypothetical protein
MNRFTKAVLLTVFAFVTCAATWAQTPPTLSLLKPESPYDAKENPYVVRNASDWGKLASDVMAGYSYDGEVIKLTANITVSTMVGGENDEYDPMYFCGTFDGNYGGTVHKLTFNYTETYLDSYIAPFYYTSGATIKNLKVDGTINTSFAYPAGLIFYNEDPSTIENVTVSVNIITTDNVGYCAGVAVYGDGLSFENCVYNGRILAYNACGGFAALDYETIPPSYNNCIFDPAEGSSTNGGFVFGPVGAITDCYYTDRIGMTAQGTEVYVNDIPEGNIGKYETKILGFDIYKTIEVAISNVNEIYSYTGDVININPTVTFDGALVTPGTYYTCSISPATVQEIGEYTLSIIGVKEQGYFGSCSKVFYVVGELSGHGTELDPYIIANVGDWFSFANKVDNGTSYKDEYLKLTADITVSTMVGTPEHPFMGHFSGQEGDTYNIHTLTFNYGTADTPTEEEIVAPFRYTSEATIEYLKVSGAIYTNVGKESGLIGINFKSDKATTVQRVIVNMNFYCNEALWDAEGGGFAYDGRCITFNSCAYQGTIAASNYHGGFCGNGDNSTSFKNCLFNPKEDGIYWAENFIYNKSGSTSSGYYESCYYTLGNNQEASTQGTLVYVHVLPAETIGRKITVLYGQDIYVPVTVAIGGVNTTYIYNGEVITINPTVTFDGVNALSNGYASYEISPSTVQDVGTYVLTITGLNFDGDHDYSGTKTKEFRVVNGSSTEWTELQALLSGSDATITLDKDYVAGLEDATLTIDRDVTINLNGHTIDRNLTDENFKVGGHVIKIGAGAHVVINGRGTITGGRNQAGNNTEHGDNTDGGGIYNMGHLTLNGRIGDSGDTIFITNSKCIKYSVGIYRTARGGGIYSGIGSTLIVHGCVIRENSAQGGGGGLFVERAHFTMDNNSSVRSNMSQDKGGGLRVDATNGSANITDSEIVSNTVEYHSNQSASNGGGIHMDGGTLNLTNCNISRNSSSKYGGGIYTTNGTVNANNCMISYNRSYDESAKFEGYGGGVCIMGGTFNMVGGSVIGNSSYIQNGGGIFVSTGKTLRLSGAVNITENWKYNDNTLTTSITNVYLMGANDKININGSIEGAFVGVGKNGVTGCFTNGLDGRGSIANFASDNEDYQILQVTVNKKAEAKIDNPAEMPGMIDDDDLPEGITIDEDVYVISIPYTIDKNVVLGKAVKFEGDGCFIITETGMLNLPSIINDDPLKLIIEDGGQIIFENPVGNIKARVKKDIEEFMPVSYNNWYLLSSPVSNPNILTATNLITLNPVMVEPTPGYDLYRFNEAVQPNAQGEVLQWENYRAGHADFTKLENGRGYLYRNCQDYTIILDGDLNVGDLEYKLSFTEQTGEEENIFKGFNIIGNPYMHNIIKYAAGKGVAIPNTYLENNCYVLDPEGCAWVLTEDGTEIPPMTGIVVQAKSASTLTIYDEASYSSKGSREDKRNIWFTVANNTYQDKACVEFNTVGGLNKIEHINENVPMLYINYDGEDFASVGMDMNTQEFDLNFKAMTTGKYTVSMKPTGEFDYIHLIDRLAGEDIDMLAEREYDFIGSPADGDNRFIVRLKKQKGSEGLDIFAYQSGSDIVVKGEGELQVFDLMGRFVKSEYVSGLETVQIPTRGVYILRLVGENLRTQKIVVK